MAKRARRRPQKAFTILAHYIDFQLEAYRLTREECATGSDGLTAAENAIEPGGKLRELPIRYRSELYKAPPVPRVCIPKVDSGKIRLIELPTFEEKIPQQAVTMVLEAVYEQDYLECSYGFGPGRSATRRSGKA